MNTMSRIILVTIVLSLSLCFSACSPAISFESDPARISDLASEITDFDMPTEYSDAISVSAMGYSVVAFGQDATPSHLYLIQSEKPVDGEKLAQKLDELVIGSRDPQTRTEVIERRPVQVRGQETTLVVSDCVNSEGRAYRQAAVVFQGNGGPALLVYSESIDNWNQLKLDALLASMRE